MRYFKFTADTCYCGTQNEYYEEFEDDITEEILNEYASEFAYENSESFGYMNDFDDEEDREAYYEEATCFYEEITEEEYREMIK